MNKVSSWLFFLLIFVFAMPCSVFPQKLSIKGTVLSANSALPIKGITILNVSLKTKTISDINGNYFIDYNKTDTIEFSHENWETKRIIGVDLKDSVFILHRSIQIDEIFLRGDGLHSRRQILEKLASEKNKNNAIYYRGQPPIALLNPFGGKPITFFYELLSKGGRNARKMNKEIAAEIANEKIRRFFNPELISSIIPLQDDDLDDFIQKYEPTAKQVENWTAYDAQVYIKECFNAYTSPKNK